MKPSEACSKADSRLQPPKLIDKPKLLRLSTKPYTTLTDGVYCFD